MTQKIITIILAAGMGTRMHSALPKVMHPVGGWPMLQHVLHTATTLGSHEIITVLAPDTREAERLCHPHPFVHQVDRLGTGHAVQLALAAHPAPDDSAIVVLYGDTPLLRPRTVQAMLEVLRTDSQCAVVVLGCRQPSDSRFGRLLLDGNNINAIIEYADATAAQRAIPLCNAGIMVLSGQHAPALLGKLSNTNSKGEYYLTDVVQHAVAQGLRARMVEVEDNSEIVGVNTRLDLAHAEALIQKRLQEAAMLGGVTMLNPDSVTLAMDTRFGRDVVLDPHIYCGLGVSIGDETRVRAFSHLEGVHIGARCVVGPFARLRPDTVLADAVRIGNFVEVKKSHIERNAKINHLSYIGDAHVGVNTNIGAGTITCNYDGYQKYPTRIGDDVFIGSNSALVAPVTIDNGAMVAAGSIITDSVPADSLGIARARQVVLKQWAERFRSKFSKKVS